MRPSSTTIAPVRSASPIASSPRIAKGTVGRSERSSRMWPPSFGASQPGHEHPCRLDERFARAGCEGACQRFVGAAVIRRSVDQVAHIAIRVAEYEHGMARTGGDASTECTEEFAGYRDKRQAANRPGVDLCG